MTIVFLENLWPCLETKIYFDTDSANCEEVDDNDIVEKWEVGSEFQHAHVAITNIACIGSTLTIKCLLDPDGCVGCDKWIFSSELRPCGDCNEMYCVVCLSKDVDICKDCKKGNTKGDDDKDHESGNNNNDKDGDEE